MKTFIKRVKKSPNSSYYYSIYMIGHSELFRVEKWSGKAFADDVTTLTGAEAKKLLNISDSKLPDFVLKEIISRLI
jgi:hypothetical protein